MNLIFKIYLNKLKEFYNLNYFFFILMIVTEILGNACLSISFLSVISFFSQSDIIIFNKLIIVYSNYLLLFISLLIFITFVVKYSNRLLIFKLLNLSNAKSLETNQKKSIVFNRIFLLSTSGNVITIVLLILISYLNFFDFIFFTFLNTLFFILPTTKIGNWIINVDKSNLVKKINNSYTVRKNGELVSIIFYLTSLIYCVIIFFLNKNYELSDFIMYFIFIRLFMNGINANIRFIFLINNLGSNQNSEIDHL